LLDEESETTLVHALETSQIDYRNAIHAGAPKTITDKLQRVLNTAQVVSDMKFACGLSTLLHDTLHWLDVPERVTFKLGLMTYCCLHGQAPRYLANRIKPAIKVVFDVQGHPRSLLSVAIKSLCTTSN